MVARAYLQGEDRNRLTVSDGQKLPIGLRESDLVTK